jgi:transposase
MDTTSLYFEGAGGQTLGRHGYSKDHRPDLRQLILAVVIDGEGRPVCSEIWPGNTADVGGLVPVIERFRRRFSRSTATDGRSARRSGLAIPPTWAVWSR